MRMLLTNDDGVNARGLKLLEAVARTITDDIWIVAPAEEQSGAGNRRHLRLLGNSIAISSLR